MSAGARPISEYWRTCLSDHDDHERCENDGISTRLVTPRNDWKWGFPNYTRLILGEVITRNVLTCNRGQKRLKMNIKATSDT
jgi:hypothetical protein